ncbi:MAG: N-acetylmuramoyl-L-alanine amidase, partial [Brevundimonas sp.]|nr:N-acetylmuramoyl-L-alanine amidase [Brevundimonas sp.]
MSRFSARERLVAVVGLLVLAVVQLAAGRGLASGALGESLRGRFGGDAERTRVVIDLDRTSRGQVIRAGD